MNEIIFYFFYNFTHQSVLLDSSVIFFADTFPYLVVAAVGFFYYTVLNPENNLRSFIEKNQEIIKVFFAAVSAWLLSVILKTLIHTERPFALFQDVIPLFDESGFAFPSSHAAMFSAVAFTIFFKNKRLGYLFLVFTLLIGVARIMAGVHFPIDILGGFVLGGLIAYFLKSV